jgi:NADP-dependent 3-hydroxy acid dehydrogenase YdfG
MNHLAVVTGATSGIGHAVSKKLASLSYHLIITGRRKELLEDLKKELEAAYDTSVLALSFDIRNVDEVKNAFEPLTGKWLDVDVLVNNAGLAAGLDHFHEANLDDWEQMIDTNVKGLLYISRLLTPAMVARKKGHVINIGSIAGKEVYEKGNVYCATKFAVDALTKAMRIDMLEHGIKVTSIDPGMVETEFSMVRFKGDQNKADSVYQGLEPLHAEDIADAVEFVVTRPPHVNINDMLIMPTAQAGAWKTHRK